MVRNRGEEGAAADGGGFHQHHAAHDTHFSAAECLRNLKGQQTDFPGFFEKLGHQTGCFGLDRFGLGQDFLGDKVADCTH